MILSNNEFAPADLAVLDTSEVNCFVETKAIDGKNEFTSKYPLRSTKSNKMLVIPLDYCFF